MQGKNSNVFSHADKVDGFKKKLDLWRTRVERGVFDMFPLLCQVMDNSLATNITPVVVEHLTSLNARFGDYFPTDPRIGNLWILDPFSLDIHSEDVNLCIELENQLSDLSSDSGLKLKFRQEPLSSFWTFLSNEYPSLSQRAVKFLLPFSTTYLCESAFSIVTTTKTKARNRLGATLSATLRVSLSHIKPRLDELVAKKQAHPSH